MLTPNELQMVLEKASLRPTQLLAERDGPICTPCIGRLLKGRYYQEGYTCMTCHRTWIGKIPLGQFMITCDKCNVYYTYVEDQHHYCDILPEPESIRRREAVLATRRKLQQ